LWYIARVLNVEQLPDDPALLKRLLLEECAARDALIIQRDAVIAQHDVMLEQIKREAAGQLEAMQQTHQAEMEAILRRFYGPRSERFDVRQLLLFGVMVDAMPLEEHAVAQEAGQKPSTRRVKNRHKHGRGKLPAHLPRVPVEHDLAEDQKPCPCCGQERQRIGQEVTEQLEFMSASFQVLQHIQHKYACRHCEQNGENPRIELAEKPSQPIDKGLAGPGLLAYVAVSKLGDHLPLYRLEHIFQRNGLEIARSTMCAWMLAMATLLKPLYELMANRVRQSRVIHTDETRVPVQAPGTGKCRSGRIWVYIGDKANAYSVYEYTPDRTRAGPSKWLQKYKGYLQADAYGGYDGIYHKGEVIEVACWAHARRKFFDAKETDARRSAQLLAMVQELYAVEDEAKSLNDQARRELRQHRSVPILGRIKVWLEAEQKLVLPRSPMALAIQYTLNQWDALCIYTSEGFLEIDNNAAERALKRVAIGRKNWLFAGNDQFGQAYAVIYTLIASAEGHGIDPQAYLTSVLAKIAQTPMGELGQFLPDVWKAEDAAEPKLSVNRSVLASSSPQLPPPTFNPPSA
jgi:transposase